MTDVMAGIFGLITVGLIMGFCFWVIDLIADGKITNPFKKYKTRNSLYECTKCDRLHRQYQRDLVRAAKGYEECPHCNQSGYGLSAINKPDKWMNTHPDCLKVNLPSYLKIVRAMRTVTRLKREREEIERFEKYNNLEPNMDWIIKLQKDLSK